jgi:hypothetical protein
MKKPDPVESASALIDELIAELTDWRGKTFRQHPPGAPDFSK